MLSYYELKGSDFYYKDFIDEFLNSEDSEAVTEEDNQRDFRNNNIEIMEDESDECDDQEKILFLP